MTSSQLNTPRKLSLDSHKEGGNGRKSQSVENSAPGKVESSQNTIHKETPTASIGL